MKIRIHCDSGANTKSAHTAEVDLEALGYSLEEWSDMSEDDKQQEAESYAWSYMGLQVWLEEVEG